MKKLILLILILGWMVPGSAQNKPDKFLKNEQAKFQTKGKPANALLREYHFEISLGADKTVIWTDIDQPLPPIFEVYQIEFKGSKATIEVSVNQNTGGGGPGTGTIVLNSDVTFGTLDFETITRTAGGNYLIIGMVSRPTAVNPIGQNALTLDFVKGSLGGLLVQVKIKMYK